jgi:hypothetical protein
MTPTLADWLLERIAEDEADAKTAAGSRPDWEWTDIAVGTYYLHAAHVRRHDPARVLAECEAKRRIVEEHPQTASIRHPVTDNKIYVCATCDSEATPCPTLRLLALPYADHPEFKPEWRVSPPCITGAASRLLTLGNTPGGEPT